jgi:acetyl esterase/lipase
MTLRGCRVIDMAYVMKSGERWFWRTMMCRASWSFLSCCFLLGAIVGTAKAQQHHRRDDAPSHANSSQCYDPGDATEIRLWEGRAPGAIGDDPCRDIPYLKIYPAAADVSATRAAIIVMPGGGYDRLSDRKEQAPVGDYFSQQLHVTTFVLFYRLVQLDGNYRYPVPMWDGQRALKLVRNRAAHYGIDPDRIGLFGFSAGGHLASTITLHSATDFGLSQRDSVDNTNARPDFLGLGYPVISMLPNSYASPHSFGHLLHGYEGHDLDRLEHYLSGQENVTAQTPPVFLFESMDDAQISPQNSVVFAQALRAAQIPADVHLFAHGVHGAGLAVGVADEEGWPDMFRDWLDKRGYLK